MGYRKATLRRMPPVTRRYARLLNEMESILRRGKNQVEEIQRQELDSRALANAKQSPGQLPVRNSGRDFELTDKK